MTKSDREKQEAREALLKWLKPGDTVYTLLDHVSRSGMMRHIRVVVPYTRDDGSTDFIHPNHSAARLLGVSQAAGDGLKMTGCGMDMGFQLVYLISHYLFPDGFGCVGKGCPSNDHSNGDRDHRKHSKRRPHWHKSGGYALRHRWL